MNALFTIFYIVIFLICLSILIIVHELGHLTAAKIFKVYCLEFSCGMGPLLWKYKRKGGETQLSLRAIPFGGYVSMYGEGVELPENATLDSSRSLNGIKKWKQAIIIVAGVTMNAVLALLIFFINNVAFDQQGFIASNMIDVVDDSICSDLNIPKESLLAFDEAWTDQQSFMLVDNADLTLTNGEHVDAKVVLSPVASFKDPVYDYYFYGINGENANTAVVYNLENISNISFTLQTKGENAQTYNLSLNVEDGVMQDSGLRIFVLTYHYSFGEAVSQTFKDFGRSATAIFDSLRMIFTGEVSVDQLSGVVGIGFEAKNILDSLGISTFIYLWGLISVNLAVVNLLPFPGLDGWQLLVIIIEGITRKKIPDKAKNIMSLIGLILLMILMVIILFKDIWVYILKGLFSGFIL